MSSIKWLPEDWDLPDAIALRIGDGVGRQRAMLEEGHLLILLHEPPGPDQDNRVGRAFWRLPSGTWKSSLEQQNCGLKRHVEEYQNAIDKVEESAASVKDAEDYFEVLERITPLYRASRNMHGALQQAREYIPDDKSLISRRDDAYAVERTAELLLADVKYALELYVARKAEDMSESGHEMAVAGHRLNTLVAVFFPVATLASVLGMNLKSGLESFPPPLPFLCVLVAGAVLGAIVKGWLQGPSRK